MKTRTTQTALHAVLSLVGLGCLLPVLLLLIASLTDEQAIVRNSYSFFPEQWSTAAYVYILNKSGRILSAYWITILTTVVGVSVGMLIMTMLAYTLSRPGLPLRKTMTFFVFFTMLFNGGLVPTYILYTQYLGMKNTLWALIVPNMLIGSFYTMMLRTFFATSIPESVIESAQLDGAGPFCIFLRICVPLAVPSIATVALFQTIMYWNSWFNGIVYISDPKLYSIQNYLNRVLLELQFLAQESVYVGGEMMSLPSASARMAIAIIAVFPILLIYPFFQRYLLKGMTVGAVKG